MTVDRWGKPIIVGWTPTEMEWMNAVLTLPERERYAAYQDIAELSGRSYANVRDKANHIRAAERRQRPAWVKPTWVPEGNTKPLPSLLKPPTKAQLMSGR